MDYLKLDYMTDAHEARLLRRMELQAKKKARKSRTNFPFHEGNREQAYKERMLLRKELRSLHLLRGYIKGTPYLRIEGSTDHAGPVNVKNIEDTAGWYMVPFNVKHFTAWLEAS